MALKRTVSLRAKLASLLASFSVGPVIAFAFWEYGVLVSTFEQSTLSTLEALARAKAESIDQFTDLRRRNVERIAGLLAPSLLELQQAREQSPLPPPPPLEELPKLRDAEDLPKPGEKMQADAGPQPAAIDAGAGGVLEDGGAALADGATRTDGAAQSTAGPPARAMPPIQPSPASQAAKVSPKQQAFDRLKHALGLILWDQRDFEELLVIDAEGRVVASTYEGHQDTSAEALEYFIQGRKTTYVQPVFQSPITKELTMVIATPIRDESSTELGVLAARLNLKRFFQLINDATGLGKTGETVVAKKMKDEITFMAPTRHDPEAALQRTAEPGSDQARALQEASHGNSGAGAQRDYRGAGVYAGWRPVESLEWGVLVKIDQSEALAPLREARNRILLGTFFVALLALVASLLVARTLVEPLRKLKAATDKISRGDLDVQLDIRSGDEIGDLADSFERMIAAIKYFRERRMEPDEESQGEIDEDSSKS